MNLLQNCRSDLYCNLKVMATMFSLLIVGLILGFGATAPMENDEALADVTRSTNDFSSTYFKELSQIKSGNLITSPISVDIVLAMLKFGASGRTLTQLNTALSSSKSDSFTSRGYRKLIEELNNKKDIDLAVASKIFPSSRYNLKQDYLNVISNDLSSDVQQLDFGKSAEAAATINSWAQEKTKNLISEIVKSDDLNHRTMMVLANAIYFKGQWATKFKQEWTRPEPFYVSENQVKQVPTMIRIGNYNSGAVPGLDARFLEIPYKDNDTSLVVILPYGSSNIMEFLNNFHTINIGDMLRSGERGEIRVSLPKFKIQSEIDLIPVLQKMGLTDMFSSSADFGRMVDAPVYVNKAIQKAVIEVNEEGSEAAAVNSFGIAYYSLPPEFTVDRPAVFAVVNRGRPLFMGVLADPTQTA